MARSRSLGAAAAAGTGALALVVLQQANAVPAQRSPAFAAVPMTIQLGTGLGPYRIGMSRRFREGLVRTTRLLDNDLAGCKGGFGLDSFVDVYRGVKLGYARLPGGGTSLDTVATT